MTMSVKQIRKSKAEDRKEKHQALVLRAKELNAQVTSVIFSREEEYKNKKPESGLIGSSMSSQFSKIIEEASRKYPGIKIDISVFDGFIRDVSVKPREYYGSRLIEMTLSTTKLEQEVDRLENFLQNVDSSWPPVPVLRAFIQGAQAGIGIHNDELRQEIRYLREQLRQTQPHTTAMTPCGPMPAYMGPFRREFGDNG